ncbi:hypothetical protein FGO68_gene14439 [Halteria grandinella]|uniref:Uncharacterized protein n=1 Tax=Halteria grandinella TaxID=5974 RepID=A0A8J8NPB9_HALGN|nr:hypothetical protein FGO68_gene14439 [Halteria grandinella]
MLLQQIKWIKDINKKQPNQYIISNEIIGKAQKKKRCLRIIVGMFVSLQRFICNIYVCAREREIEYRIQSLVYLAFHVDSRIMQVHTSFPSRQMLMNGQRS